MANIVKRKNANGTRSWLIQFVFYGRRKTISFGTKYEYDEIDAYRQIIESLCINHELGRTVPRKLQTQIDLLPKEVKRKLGQTGLTQSIVRMNVGEIWEAFLSDPVQKAMRKPTTCRNYLVGKDRFFDFFKPEVYPDEITSGDAIAWKRYLTSKFTEASAAGYIQRTKVVFKWAAENKMCDASPFANLKKGSYVNKNREFYITMKHYEKLLDACPDQTWRTIVALCRIGGLRNPSETLAMRWEDVNWDENRVLIHSVKTEAYEGKATRIIPLFPELKKELERQLQEAEKGSVFVIDRWRSTQKNMRTHFERIIYRAGLDQWPRLFHNLRGSRSCELFSQYPAHVASYWMGQSSRIALEHYLHPTDEQYNDALEEEKETPKTENPPDNNEKGNNPADFEEK